MALIEGCKIVANLPRNLSLRKLGLDQTIVYTFGFEEELMAIADDKHQDSIGIPDTSCYSSITQLVQLIQLSQLEITTFWEVAIANAIATVVN